MKFFRSHKKTPSMSDSAAGKIADKILQIQRHFGIGMGKLTKNWERKQQWVFLYLVCLAFGTLSILAIARPFSNSGNNTIMPKAISRPTTQKHEQNMLVITEEEFQQVQAYKRANPDLEETRPSLLDSLNLIEQIYYSQKHK